MARLNVNQLRFDEEVGGTQKLKKVRKFKESTFDGDYTDMRKQYKRKR